MATYKEVQIPFTGFYESSHDALFDDYLERECEYYSQEYGASEDDLEKLQSAYYDLDWKAIHLKYAQDYCAELFDKIEEESGMKFRWQFKAMESPKYYNYDTDRIYCDMAAPDIRRMFKEVDKPTLDKVAAERHTSYSGFISFYSPLWREWGHVSEWDHNQLCTLFIAWLSAWFDDNRAMSGEGCFSAWDLMEDFIGNGRIETWISAADNSTAYWDILNSLDEKAA